MTRRWWRKPDPIPIVPKVDTAMQDVLVRLDELSREGVRVVVERAEPFDKGPAYRGVVKVADYTLWTGPEHVVRERQKVIESMDAPNVWTWSWNQALDDCRAFAKRDAQRAIRDALSSLLNPGVKS